jgi:hypothetical protein
MMIHFSGCSSNTPAEPTDPDVAAPTNILAGSADGGVILSWTPSTSESASNFGKYVITGTNESTNKSFTVVAPKGASKFTVDSLTNGTRYLFVVRSETSQGKQSPDFVQIEWAPAVRQNTDLNGSIITVYATTSKNNSAVDLYNSLGYAEVIPQSGQTFKDRGSLYVYASDVASASLSITSPDLANNQGLVTQFSTNSGVAVNSLDDQLATSSPNSNSYTATTISIADAPATSSMVYFGRLVRGTDYYYFRLLVVLGSNGRLVQGSGADRYLQLIVSFQSAANVPFAKHNR